MTVSKRSASDLHARRFNDGITLRQMTNEKQSQSKVLVLVEQEDGSHIHGIIPETELQKPPSHAFSVQPLEDSHPLRTTRGQIIRSLSLKTAEDERVSNKIETAKELEPDINWEQYLYATVKIPDELELVEIEGAFILEEDGSHSWSRDNLISAAEFYAPGQQLPEVRSVFEEEANAPYPLLIAIPPRTGGRV